jgi:hypothetical protein
MRSIKQSGKLAIHRETLRRLSNEALADVNGGTGRGTSDQTVCFHCPDVPPTTKMTKAEPASCKDECR